MAIDWAKENFKSELAALQADPNWKRTIENLTAEEWDRLSREAGRYWNYWGCRGTADKTVEDAVALAIRSYEGRNRRKGQPTKQTEKEGYLSSGHLKITRHGRSYEVECF
jgi:hypothetical protein